MICKDKDVFLSFDKNYYKLSDGDAKEENADGILWETCYTDSTIYRRLQQMWRIPEVIKNEVTGLLTNPHDYEGTAKKILQLVLDSRMRTDMGRKAHEWVTSQFTIDRMVRVYVELYNIENR